jgi:hypothetical protein
MIQRLNVKSTVQKSRLYLAHHLATADTKEGEIDVLGTSYGIVLHGVGKNNEVYISYEDLVREAVKVI